ncbi:hypothetical protein [Sandaracinus amylolyticus]|uniref:Uncharacterized protein n=1 Tax=Sandaracinus amylolyticus TaxID=927083 RepID=A0A0F6YL41_9BACT|nr:hypothetical protein [Sandaracinus amylolyticus]AKF08885.1 hypothetical protein DB32_006034 [Sandaracinus amylolyticus]
MPAYIETSYIDAFIGGQAVRERLFTDDGVYNAAADAVVLAAAQAVVDSAISFALEVSVPLSGTIPEVVKLATFGQYVLKAHGRKRIAVPEQWRVEVNLAEGIRSGAVAIPELAADLEEAIGGITASESDASVEGSKPLHLGIDNLDSW